MAIDENVCRLKHTRPAKKDHQFESMRAFPLRREPAALFERKPRVCIIGAQFKLA